MAVWSESISAGTAFDDLPRKLSDPLLRNVRCAVATDSNRGWVNSADQIRTASGGIVVGRVVERLDSDPQRRISVCHLRIQLLYGRFSKNRARTDRLVALF